MAPVDMSKVEQGYRAVFAVPCGKRIGEVAARFDVSRQSIHAWLVRYGETAGLAGLTDRSHRPDGCCIRRRRRWRRLCANCGGRIRYLAPR
jgi:hypothetical protein